MSNQIKKDDLKRAISDVQLTSSLNGDRLLILTSLVASLASAAILVYLAFGKDRLELVYLQQDKIDVPTLLDKVRTDDDSLKADRWVRGFTRRFIAYYFLNPDDSAQFSKKALAWLHAHSSEAGQLRSESLASDFSKFEGTRKVKHTAFFPVNDPAALKIRQSAENSDIIFVEVSGTFQTKNQEGESLFDATLKLVVKKVPISGIESGMGEINATGLVVQEGAIEFVEDYTRANEVSRLVLFGSK
jgi:hypothetical protein